MRHFSKTLSTLAALGIVSALSVGQTSAAADARQAPSTAAAKAPRTTTLKVKPGATKPSQSDPQYSETVSFTFHQVQSTFNPKEIAVDKSVPWKQGESTAMQVKRAMDRHLKRAAKPTANDVALETVTLVHEGFEIQ